MRTDDATYSVALDRIKQAGYELPQSHLKLIEHRCSRFKYSDEKKRIVKEIAAKTKDAVNHKFETYKANHMPNLKTKTWLYKGRDPSGFALVKRRDPLGPTHLFSEWWLTQPERPKRKFNN